MAIKKPTQSTNPGYSGNPKKTFSNLPVDGVRQGPRVGLSWGNQPIAPQVQSTGGLSQYGPGSSGIPGAPLPTSPTGKPRALTSRETASAKTTCLATASISPIRPISNHHILS